MDAPTTPNLGSLPLTRRVLLALPEAERPLAGAGGAMASLSHETGESRLHHVPRVPASRAAGRFGLTSGFQTLTDRHDALRTDFWHREGVPFQRVHPRWTAHFTEADATAWTEARLANHLAESGWGKWNFLPSRWM
jgi:hypothetical protein